MDTKMRNEDFINPSANPPPYTGPTDQSYTAGPSYPAYAAQPQMSGAPQMTGVHMTTVYPGSATIIQGSTVVPVVINAMGPDPSPVICKSCHMQVITRTERKAATRTHCFAIFMCLFLCWPCAWLPYCIDSCNNADHYCPNCSAYIGSYIG